MKHNIPLRSLDNNHIYKIGTCEIVLRERERERERERNKDVYKIGRKDNFILVYMEVYVQITGSLAMFFNIINFISKYLQYFLFKIRPFIFIYEVMPSFFIDSMARGIIVFIINAIKRY